jgi:hypothetical protein
MVCGLGQSIAFHLFGGLKFCLKAWKPFGLPITAPEGLYRTEAGIYPAECGCEFSNAIALCFDLSDDFGNKTRRRKGREENFMKNTSRSSFLRGLIGLVLTTPCLVYNQPDGTNPNSPESS